jgi:hypothetical protein
MIGLIRPIGLIWISRIGRIGPIEKLDEPKGWPS